jgi:3-isopropylmalate/(R)-2-methylmalate dehydratase large subunit
MRTSTFTEKMFAQASGRDRATAGEDLHPDPSWVIIHDSYLGAAYRELTEIGYRRISNPGRVIAITDHEVLHTSPAALIRAQLNRKIAREWALGHYFDAGQAGHGHLYPMEAGFAVPGMFLAAYDVHCSNFCAIGAYALAASADVTVILATGSRLTTVPETVLVKLSGDFPLGVHARDVGYRFANDLASGMYGFDGEAAVVEFQGDGAERMTIAGRIGLINTLTETNVAHVLFPPRQFDGNPANELQDLPSDANACFRGQIDLNLDMATPTVALPGAPSNAADISVAAGQRIDHAFIGACGSCHYDDFVAAARILNGRSVALGVRMFIVPGTNGTVRRMMNDGVAQIFLDAGAIMLPPGCGPCAGGAMAPLGPGEVSISTAATNNRGRMGSPEAQCYLGSPLSVAAAAVCGRIVDPREMLLKGYTC